jgi:hypothetical protein
MLNLGDAGLRTRNEKEPRLATGLPRTELRSAFGISRFTLKQRTLHCRSIAPAIWKPHGVARDGLFVRSFMDPFLVRAVAIAVVLIITVVVMSGWFNHRDRK